MALDSNQGSVALRRKIDEEYAEITPSKPKKLVHTDNAPASTATDASVTETAAPFGSFTDENKAAAAAAANFPKCPSSIVHDPRETGDRLYTAYYGTGGATAPRGFASSPKDFLNKMYELEAQRCGDYTPPTFERKRDLTQPPTNPEPATPTTTLSQMGGINKGCSLWRNVMLAMVGAAVGYVAVQRYMRSSK